MKHVNPVARWMFWAVVLVFVSFAVAGIATAQGSPMDGFKMGAVQVAGVSVCRDAETAKSVLDAEENGGFDAGNAVYMKAQQDNLCANVPGLSFVPIRIVYSVKTERGVGTVVEIADPDDRSLKLYWLTYAKPSSYKEI